VKAPLEHRHAHGDPEGHLPQDDASPGAVGGDRVDLDSPIERAGVHHHGVRRQTFEPQRGQPEDLVEVGGDGPSSLALELHPQHHDRIEGVQFGIDLMSHPHASRSDGDSLEALRDQRGRADQDHLGAERNQPVQRRSGHAAVADVADDGHAAIGEVSKSFTHRQEIEEALRRMGMAAVAGIDNRNLDRAGQKVGGAGGGVSDHDGIDAHGLDVPSGVGERLALADARAPLREIHHLGAESLGRDGEADSRSSAVLEEEIGDEPPLERGSGGAVAFGRGNVAACRIEQLDDGLAGKTGEVQKIAEFAGGALERGGHGESVSQATADRGAELPRSHRPRLESPLPSGPLMTVQFKHAVLKNGLTIVAEIDDSAHTSAAGFFVRTGARDEAPELMGVSHFLEHMMFKGSLKRLAEQVNAEFDDLGADHNAFTSSELTAFWAHTLPDRLPAAVDVLGDILRPALRDTDFDEEKGVILEEIAMYDDQPFWVLYERAMEAHYGRHPLAHRVLGTKESIAALSCVQMRDYFEKRYSADNTVLSLAGRLDFDAMVAQIEALCAGWQTTRPVREHVPIPREPQVVDVHFTKSVRHYEIMALEAPSAQSDLRYAAAIASDILGDADGSRLYWALVEPGIAEEAGAQYEGRDGNGVLFVSFTCPPEDATRARAIVLEQLRGFAESLTEDDLARAARKIATSLTLAGERPAGRMRRLGHVWTSLGRYESLEHDLERIESLRVADLRAMLREFPLEPQTIASLHPPAAV